MEKAARKLVLALDLEKKHGPKKRMFHKYSKCIRIEMAKLGMLKKDVDPEAREQSESAKNPKGKR